jgi:type IV secretion system protein VirB11
LFIERLGHGAGAAGEMNAATAEIVTGSVAHALHSEADEDRPIISGVNGGTKTGHAAAQK